MERATKPVTRNGIDKVLGFLPIFEQERYEFAEWTRGEGGVTKVGVYDSRVIALAYWEQEVDGKHRMHRHEDLSMEAIDLGMLMHRQAIP